MKHQVLFSSKDFSKKKINVSSAAIFVCRFKGSGIGTNSASPDQTQHNVVSDQGIHYLL